MPDLSHLDTTHTYDLDASPPELREGELVIGWCDGGTWDARFGSSLVDLLAEDGYKAKRRSIAARIEVTSGPLIASARNSIVERFLADHDAPYLLMVDTDMVFTPDDVYRLLDTAVTVDLQLLGGLCCSVSEHGETKSTMKVLAELDADRVNTMESVTDWDDGVLRQVHATGAAFLLIGRSLLEKMRAATFASLHGPDECARRGLDPDQKVWPQPFIWFAHVARGEHEMAGSVGEDVEFCLRAQSLGVPVMVHTGVVVGHAKTVVFYPQRGPAAPVPATAKDERAAVVRAAVPDVETQMADLTRVEAR